MASASAWIIALSPWAITLSRLGYENHVALALTVAGFSCLLLIRKGKNTFLLFSLALVALIFSTFTYAAERVFIPLMLTLIFILSFLKDSQFRSIRKQTVILLLIIVATTIVSLIPWQNRGRAEAVMWKEIDPSQANRLQQLHIEAGISPVKIPVAATRSFHNKARIAIEDFLYRYSNHFSPKFLFFEGEAATERIPDTGLLPLILIFFLPAGLLFLLTYKKES